MLLDADVAKTQTMWQNATPDSSTLWGGSTPQTKNKKQKTKNKKQKTKNSE
jgi:hypothetical protein